MIIFGNSYNVSKALGSGWLRVGLGIREAELVFNVYSMTLFFTNEPKVEQNNDSLSISRNNDTKIKMSKFRSETLLVLASHFSPKGLADTRL